MLLQNKKVLVGVGFFLILLLFFVSFVLFRNQQKQTDIDNPSGEEISAPEGKSPESFGVGNEPVFYGTAELLRQGVGTFMVDSFRQQTILFGEKSKININQVSIYKDSISTSSMDEYTNTTFTIQVNQSHDYLVTLQHQSMLDVRVLFKEGSATVFDSGVINYISPDDEYTGDGKPVYE